jgi:hypothetical protein
MLGGPGKAAFRARRGSYRKTRGCPSAVIILLGFDSAYLAARPERRNHSRYFGQWGPADLSNIAMLSAQNAEEGLLLVTRSSDINSNTNRFLHIRGNLLGHSTIELCAKVIAVAGKIVNRGGRREVLSHRGCRSHRTYYAI